MKNRLTPLIICIAALTLLVSHSPVLVGGESLSVFEDNFDRRNTAPNELGNDWQYAFGLGGNDIHIENRKALFKLQNGLFSDYFVRHDFANISASEDFDAQIDFKVAATDNTPDNFRLTFSLSKLHSDPFGLKDACVVTLNRNTLRVSLTSDALNIGTHVVDTPNFFDGSTYRLGLNSSGDQYTATLINLNQPQNVTRCVLKTDETIEVNRVQLSGENFAQDNNGLPGWTTGTWDNLVITKN